MRQSRAIGQSQHKNQGFRDRFSNSTIFPQCNMGNNLSSFLQTVGLQRRSYLPGTDPEVIWQIRPRRAPRDLERILGSEDSTKEFRCLLRNLDIGSETDTGITCLDFWIACHSLQFLQKIGDIAAVKERLGQMHEEFFKTKDCTFLSSKALHKACKKICARKRTSDLRPLWIAQNEVIQKLQKIQSEHTNQW